MAQAGVRELSTVAQLVITVIYNNNLCKSGNSKNTRISLLETQFNSVELSFRESRSECAQKGLIEKAARLQV
jgi:hypothetical protein